MKASGAKATVHKPRVVIIENSVDVTGAATSIVRSCEMLRNSFEFFFVLPSNSRAVELFQRKGFEVTTLPMREIRKTFWSIVLYIPYLLLNARRLRSLVHSKDVELVVNNDFYNLIPVLCRFLPGRKVPYVCFVRFLPSKFPAPLVRFWCSLHARYASHVIAVSNAVRKELPFQKNVSVIYNQLPAEEIMYEPTPSNVILYPSNYIVGKGHEYALESFARVADRYPDWTMMFVGSHMGLQKNKDFKTALIHRAFKLGLQNRVEWHGPIQYMGPLYRHAGLVLNFSESESFSLTCLEALFYGRPLIATACGGPSEIIDAPETGLLVPVGDIDAMAQAIESLLADESRRQRMGKKAHAGIRNKFSDESTVRKLGEIFSRFIATKTPTFNNR
jgi:glycosyltransferase involved in cell wall biosynthesis